MPATRKFEFTLHPGDRDVATYSRAASKVLAWACDGDDRITCHGVTGEAFGVITLSFTVRGRDRWWAGQLGQDIIDIVKKNVADKLGRVEATSEPLPPHDHRGYAHGRTKRWRVNRSRSGAQTASRQP